MSVTRCVGCGLSVDEENEIEAMQKTISAGLVAYSFTPTDIRTLCGDCAERMEAIRRPLFDEYQERKQEGQMKELSIIKQEHSAKVVPIGGVH